MIDFTKVDYGVGDGPGWVVLAEAAKGVKITYLVGGPSGRRLRDAFAFMGLERIINVVVVDGL